MYRQETGLDPGPQTAGGVLSIGMHFHLVLDVHMTVEAGNESQAGGAQVDSLRG